MDWNGQAARHIQAMTQTIAHRGPDGEGYAAFRFGESQAHLGRGPQTPAEFAHLPTITALSQDSFPVALGHRRLSILDLSSAGHNPLPNHDHSLWITYNGEVYNYLELRAELSARGYRFLSGTDTEVILAAYREWGLAAPHHFNGMFAFAIWDVPRQRLFCARDRFGVKPFYYVQRQGFLAFASEIKALLAHPQVQRCARPQAIYDYLVNGAIVEGQQTFFEGIQQLRGGHALTLDAEGHFEVWQYYHLAYQTAFEAPDYPAQAEALRHLLTDAVRLRLRSDVPVGSSLSGGLDSSSVVMLANQLLQTEQGIRREIIGEQQRVFCAVYAGERFDEQPHMQTIITQTGAQAHFVRPTASQLWDDLPALVWHQDEPFNSSAIFAQYCVMRLARHNGVTVLLDGQGGDEVLAGYPFYYGYFIAQALRAGYLMTGLRETWAARRLGGVSWTQLLALTGWNLSPQAGRQLGWRWGGSRLLSNQPIDDALVNAEFAQQYYQAAQIKHRPYPSLAQKLYDDVLHTSLPILLRYEDRNSMAFHIEARVPFLDYRLVEMAFNLGAQARIRDGWSKAILRHAMHGILPESIRLRKDKEGYTTPQRRWLTELAPQINQFFAREVRAKAYLSPQAIAQLRSPQVGQTMGLWRLLNLESWLRAFEL
jgi:asparagine synthase (glutamine-hydrolysing)